jgi:hypothetical protein
MSWLARIEEACAGFIERAFANMFPSDVEPAQIARKLVATMEARTKTADEGGLTAPARYAVYVHTSDYERLLPHRSYLEEEWSSLLREVAQRVGITFTSPTAVELHENDAGVPGAIEIEAIDSIEAAPSALALRLVSGMPSGGRFLITRPMRVGRNKDCDIFLVDPSVSRNHAMLEPREGHILVRDSGSTNGTFVNGERVQLRTVGAGDRVAFGKTELVVEAERA